MATRRAPSKPVEPPEPPQPPAAEPVPSLQRKVLESIASMPWLKKADQGAAALAVMYAAQIDDRAEHGTAEELTKALYLGPHLLRVLESLQGTPAARGDGNDVPVTPTAPEGPKGTLRLLQADARRQTA